MREVCGIRRHRLQHLDMAQYFIQSRALWASANHGDSVNLADRNNTLPNLLVIGAQKAGSTWLHEQLATHPDIFMSEPKELRFFGHKDKTDSSEGIAAYQAEFSAGAYQRYRGESTPAYFWSDDATSEFARDLKRSNRDIPEVVARILGPSPALIVSLRNPVARAISAFYHHHRAGNITTRDTIRDQGHRWGIVDMGFYRRHLEAWLRHFNAEQLHVVVFDDIRDRPETVMRKLYQWLDLPEAASNQSLYLPSNQGASKPLEESTQQAAISQQDIEYLAELYRDDISFVEEYLSRDLNTWRSMALEDYMQR